MIHHHCKKIGLLWSRSRSALVQNLIVCQSYIFCTTDIATEVGVGMTIANKHLVQAKWGTLC